MGWRSTGGAFRAGNYNGPLTSDEGGFASGFAKTFTAGISKASDIIAGEMQAQRDQKREEDLIRLRETLAAQRAAATASRTRDKADGDALNWAMSYATRMGLDLTPDNITALSATYTSEGNEGRAAKAADEMVIGGSLKLAPETPVATGAEDTSVSSQNAVDLPNVFDDLEQANPESVAVAGPEVVGPEPVIAVEPDPVATEDPDPVVTAVEPEIADASTVTEPVAQQADPIDFNSLSGGQALFVSELRKLDAEELRKYADTSNPNTFQGRLSRQLYQDSRTREIMQITDEVTLRTILQNGTEWEQEAVRKVFSNMSNPTGSVRVRLGDGTFVMAQQGRGDDGKPQFVDMASGNPIAQDINAVLDPTEDGEVIDRAMSQYRGSNAVVTEARTNLRGYIAAADAAFKMTEILSRNQSILTFTGGVIPATISRIESELMGINSIFGEEGEERNLNPDQVFARFDYLEREANDLFNNTKIDQAARDRAIYLAQEKRLAYIVARSQQGPAGVISNQDYNSALESVRASVNAGTFEESLRKLIVADETTVRIAMEQAANNEGVRAAQLIIDQQGVDFPLVQDLFRTIPENFERYGVGDAYQWLQGEINLAQGQSATLPPLGETQTVPLMDRVSSPEQLPTANVVVRETTIDAMRRYVEEKGGTELSRQAAVSVILDSTPGLTEDQLRQMHPEFFTDISE
jgi:hypothetical protein